MPDITVPVPDDRTADFYQFFGRWLSGALEASTEGLQSSGQPSETHQDKRASWTGSDDEADDAEFLWRKLTKRAKGMFNLLMAEPGKRYTGKEIAAALDIPHGANGVAGVLAWPGRYCWNLSRYLPTHWKDGEDGAESVYWMKPEVAQLFSQARVKVEG